MQVLLVSQYFPPETGGPPNRAASLARGIRAAGHAIEVIAEKPSHPEGRIWPDFRGGLTQQRLWEGIPVHYVWVYASPKKVLWTRVANHVSFLLMAVLASLRLRGRVDVVLSTSPPLFAGAAGRAIARLRGSRHVLDVRDLWPDIAVAMGELRNPRWIGLSKWLERSLYRSADAVTAVTESFCATIAAQTSRPGAVHLIRNGSHPEYFGNRSPTACAGLRANLGAAANRFVVAYVGNLGLAQGLEHVVDAAGILAQANEPVLFVIVGSGPVEARLRARAAKLQLANLLFVPRVDQARAADWMAAADALLVSLADVDMLQQFVPSKLYDALAAGRPVLLGARGEAQRLLETSGGGTAYWPEDATSLVTAVRELRADPERSRRLGLQGAAFAREHCDRAQHARAMVAVLEAVAGARSPCILHAGPFPPPVEGGIAAYLEGMLASPLAERFTIESFNMRVSEFYRRHRVLRFGLGLRWLWRFARTLRRSRAEIVHMHTSGHLGFWERSLYGELSARLGRACVLHVHGGDFDHFLIAMPRWQRRFASRAFRRAAAVVIPSHAWRKHFTAWVAPERLYTVPNAIHVASFPAAGQASAAGPVRILFVGMLSARKGLDELCTALVQLVRDGVRGFEVDLLGGEEVLGDGKRYRTLYQEAGLTAWAHFHGLQAGAAKLEFYQRASIFVLPSRSESFGIANLEAMASGLPVISTRTGAIPEYIVSEVHGLLIEPGDAEALARALRRLIEDPALRARLGAAAREQAARYDWSVVARDLERVYDDVRSRTAGTRGGVRTHSGADISNPAGS